MINRDSAFICKLKVVKRTRSTAPLSSVIDPSIIPDEIARVKEARYKLSEKNITRNGTKRKSNAKYLMSYQLT